MSFEKIENVKHGPYIAEFKGGSSLHETITAPMIGAFGGKDFDGANLSVGFSYLTEPLLMIPHTHKHDFDQFLFFIGGDPTNFIDFGGEIDLTLGEEVNTITYSSWVFIPKGLDHCPLEVKKVNQPIMFIDARLAREASVRHEQS